MRRYKNIDEFLQKNFSYDGGGDMDKSVKEAYTAAGIQTLFSSTKGSIIHSDIKFKKDCYVFFGRETRGLPEPLLKANYENTFRIPMRAEARSLNLSNSVAVVIYEYLRQHNYNNLKTEGKLKI